jgi:oxygen-independent coproporphyrinogen-3 oxidase
VEPPERLTGALAFDHRVEVGPWFDVGAAMDGASVWHYLGDRYGKADSPPYCVYVHVPFCASRCSYCALYTTAVPGDAHETFDEYVALAVRATREHPARKAKNAPTTVHFGGGTPLHIGLERFGHLTEEIRTAFGDSPDCEWALETTTSSIDDRTAEALRGFGFSRIHLGIQTLNDTVRRSIQRRESGRDALEKIEVLKRAGFLVSVDLIIGLDGGREPVIREDLRLLHEVGVRTFSICELRTLVADRPGEPGAAGESEDNFRLWGLVWQFMESRGLIPIHLGQFGSGPEDNLYFTHPARDEDCVVIGPYAHGSAGRVYYGNLLLPAYYEAVRVGDSPVESGVFYDDAIQRIRALERGLLGHRLARQSVRTASLEYGDRFDQVFGSWLDQGLLVAGQADEPYRLSLEGSWLVGNMVQQMRHLVSPEPSGRRALRRVRERVFSSTGENR